MLKAQGVAVPDAEPRMLLKTIVAAMSPWVRIPRPPLEPRETIPTWDMDLEPCAQVTAVNARRARPQQRLQDGRQEASGVTLLLRPKRGEASDNDRTGR